MSNAYIPLIFRLTTLALSCIALGLACRIVVLSDKLDSSNKISQQPSSIMAIVVQSVAIAYLFYISYDEFSGQPIGLRDPYAKIRLMLLDLFFIIFSSANLALAFNTLYDSRWVCRGARVDASSGLISSMCDRQRALSAFLFLALVAWCVTFTISVFRVVLVVSNNSRRQA
ncbi:unnamed protein product [Ambrosiozyma monospora]|uniref:Unnamed protein product n=1 Tax=Ambrosiozyma monospora TaxID=43982 RepID=A0ACB5TCE3_AMBMO|nr:unnamed protein product [Ambrosiozyma monospora]